MDITDLIQVKIKLEEGGIMPQKKSIQAAAFDVYCPDDIPISVGRQIIDLKFKMWMPPFIKANMRPRSGHSSRGFEVVQIRNGIREKKYLNADVILGLVDSDYRNNVGVILKVDYTQPEDIRDCYIEKGSRIGQMEFAFVPNISLLKTESLDMSVDRGGGFGHTNNK